MSSILCNNRGMEESKSKPKYKTAAAIRRVMEDRLESERIDLGENQAEQERIEARIFMIQELLATVDANGKEEDGDA